ncbi:Tigger transposable element-derived protein 6 [Dictyocoela muelleri]|nr:Tigger transposable element-derived protein 6 [Dictyocoela muelleri]
MRTSDFNLWLFDLNQSFKQKKQKILLVLDNCPSHKVTCELTNIETLFLPKNSTSRLQPLDAGIIRSFKAKFFNHQLTSIVQKVSPTVHIETLYKNLTLKDAVIFCKYAWDEVSCETIRNCWKKALPIFVQSDISPDEYFGDCDIIDYDDITKALFDEEAISEKELLLFDTNQEIKFEEIKEDDNSLIRENNLSEEIKIQENSRKTNNDQIIREKVSYNSAIQCFEDLKDFLF